MAKLDQVIQSWTNLPKQRYMRNHYLDYPRTLFSNGVSTITETSAATKVGMLLSVVFFSSTVQGQKIFLKSEKDHFPNYLSMIHVFEMLLFYWGWLEKNILEKK